MAGTVVELVAETAAEVVAVTAAEVVVETAPEPGVAGSCTLAANIVVAAVVVGSMRWADTVG